MLLDPQARALLDLIESRGLPATHQLTPVDARAFYRERRTFTQPDPRPMAEVRDLLAPGPGGPLPMRLYRPETAPAQAPTLVYLHGGGWVIGDLDTHDVLCRDLAAEAACVVVAVDYRMGPEHPFPAAVDDALAATRWLHAQATEFGLDPQCFAVGGDSAGGNLAAVVALALRDAGDALPLKLQLLIYPATDMRAQAPSHRSNGQGYLLTADTIAYFQRHYLRPEQLMRSRYTAYVLELADYLLATWHRNTRPGVLHFDPGLRWLGLDLRRHVVGTDGRTATVEFVERSKSGGRAHRLHELSRFTLEAGRWTYIDGDLLGSTSRGPDRWSSSG